jgi:hypothetical protein
MNTWPHWHLVLLVLLFVLYFLPTIIALFRRSRLTVPLVLVNLVLGWTLIGWVVALVVVCWPDRAYPRRYPRNDLPTHYDDDLP